MPTLTTRSFTWTLAVLTLAMAAAAQDLHIKKSITVGGNFVSSSETSIQGARERTVSLSPTGNTVTLRQCDLKRTININEQAQTYLVTNDAPDDAALKAAALVSGAPASESGAYITQTTTVTDTGERKTMYGYSVRHLKSTVSVEPSKNACSQTAQKFEVDGWYTDISKEQTAACGQFLPPVRQSEGCSDRVIRRRSGGGKPGYPMQEKILFHNADGTNTEIGVNTSEFSKQTLEKELFDIPPGYQEVKSLAELNGGPRPQVAQQPVVSTPAPTPDPNSAQQASGGNGLDQNATAKKNKKMKNPLAQALGMGGGTGTNVAGGPASAMMMTPGAGNMPGMAGMPGMQGGMQQAASKTPIPQALGPKAAGKIRIGIAPPDAQVGQGSNAGADNSTPIRNAVVALMSGPAVEIAALDSHIPMQVQAEAQQKQCDYILYSAVTVKHSTGGGFGKFMKLAGPVASMTPMGMMAHGMGGAIAAQTAGMAAQAASQVAQQQAISQLAGFNGQIKSKDDVTVQYQLVQTGQATPLVQNALAGKAKSDGEDVLTPLLQQAATTVLTEVSKK